MSYTLTRTDGQSSISVAPLATDISTSLTFYGRGATNYGEGQQTNMLRILESFAHTSPPAHAVVGQLWFDKNANILKVCTDPNAANPWSTTAASSTSAGPSAPTPAVLGQLWYDTSPDQLCLKVYAAIGAGFGWQRVAISAVASSQVPIPENGYSAPIIGQLWYDTTHLVFKQYMGGYDTATHNAGTWTPIEVKGSSTGPTPPTNPVIGQLWFDTTNSALKAYDGTTWLGVTNVVTNPGTASPTSSQVGELWFDTHTNELKVYNGTTWLSSKPDPALQYLAFVV